MTINQKETIQRAVGIIEGVSYFVNEKASEALVTAVEMLDGVLADAGVDDRG